MAFIEPNGGTLARIKVVGVGGGGQNAVSSMFESGKTDGVEFIAMNTDLQSLNASQAQVRVQLGPQRTRGLGSGSDPEVGDEAARESEKEIEAHLQGSDMVFIAAGMGGGTGTGAAPVVAQISKQLGALTVGVVTKPFGFEGKRRMNQAEQGIRELRDKVDALIVIPNEKLLEVVDPAMPLSHAFKVADEVVGNAVKGLSDLINSTGLVNVDFADVRTIMQDAGSALMGIGEDDGENRATKAAELAINSPLLGVDINGSTGILMYIVGDANMTMHEVNTAARIVSDAAHEAANIIFGANIDPNIKGIKVTVIATGFDSGYKSVGIPEMPSITSDEVIKQIDSRFDKVDDDESEDDVEDVDNFDNNLSDDDSEFDIEKMRNQVRRLEKEENERRKVQEEKEATVESEVPSDEKGKSFWNFIKKSKEPE
ncbi:cell division protein FtsZ [candidate division WWE3 bacterium CG_4_9_14_0_2_um_filter_35_11]|uniref:Cell division protein FtsZ n=1 Tax=candidate division WWE3 bacterium CG_4_9_14_0_2_um_filter_35_11 TaxID=1975077 RepID=A0A2M8EMD5_UNCKA|nr:MAG: cell division protein FtsZ [candidate division WWE3 bacterium CG10_big_fil_rev_8_21_14_0_10_35_32]PJC23885.1 MAG: cell division protein FtsZ [candidate division WWE3 bacterium CG_4_9_14_0_2_um_filter_35_11]